VLKQELVLCMIIRSILRRIASFQTIIICLEKKKKKKILQQRIFKIFNYFFISQKTFEVLNFYTSIYYNPQLRKKFCLRNKKFSL
jgi:hypothetical protein